MPSSLTRPGVPGDGYATLSALARDAGVPVVLDAEGDALRLGARGRPTVAKPNVHELSGLVPHGGIADGVAALREAGAGAVVVSLGADGLLAVTPEGGWSVVPAERVSGNPTGAGDALAAALAAGLAANRPWPELLADAVALSAAAVLALHAGEFDHHAYRRFPSAGATSGGRYPCRYREPVRSSPPAPRPVAE